MKRLIRNTVQQGQEPITGMVEGVGQGEGEKAPEAAPEQAAELRALTVDAAGGEPDTVEGQEQAAPRIPLDQEIAALMTGLVAMVSPAFPSIKGIYTPQVVETAAASVAAVCNKHGWMQDGVMGKYGEEIGCTFVVLPLAFVTYKAVSHDLAQMAIEKAKESARTVEQKPGAVDREQVQGDALA